MSDGHDLPGFEHDHELLGGDVVTEDIEGLEMFTLRSVGIDIGSSTSHLVFSRLTLRREGAAFSAKFRVSDREVLYRSKIMLTPYITGTQIDTDRVTQFIHQAYAEAGFTSGEIDTGAVVITGEALKKENARPIAEFFSADSGKFICASAGPNHEAILAAHGCGAVALSKDNRSTVLNMDCGGGTAKFSIITDGVVTQTCAVEVGARLIAFDEDEIVTRIEEPAKKIMKEAGFTVDLGDRITEDNREKLAQVLARVLFEVARGGPHSALTKSLLLTEPISGYQDFQGISRIIFSGGVSEYVYEHEKTTYGDLGPLFGKAIREQLKQVGRPDLVVEPLEGIRATVIGAGEYTIQASGTTSYISSTDALPVYALQVVRPVFDHAGSVEVALKGGLAKFDLDEMIPGLAIAITLSGQQNYESLRRIADGVAAVLPEENGQADPVFLVLNLDVAKSLGGILKEELNIGREIVALDGIDVGDLDYIDIGRPVGTSEVLPVTVKSLLFPSEQKKAEEAAVARN
jgi:ethanolamine utilization protein EutA